MKLPFEWMFHKGERSSWGLRPQARAIRFRTPWRDPGGVKDQITERARHPVGRCSRQGS